MNIVLNGFKSFYRNKKSSLSLMAIVAVIAAALMVISLLLDVSMVYKSRTENPYSDYYRLLRYNMMPVYTDNPQTNENAEPVRMDDYRYKSVEMMESAPLSRVELVDKYYLDVTNYVGVTKISTECKFKPYMPEWLENKKSYLFTVNSLTEIYELPVFARGEYSLTEGRFINRYDRNAGRRVCVISDVVAEINGLSVGDKCEISVSREADEKLRITHFYEEFTVVGIYHINTSGEIKRGYTTSDYLSENTVYVPLGTLIFNGSFSNAQLRLSDGDVADLLLKDTAKRGILNDNYHLIRVKDIYAVSNRAVHSLENAFVIIQYIFSAVAAFIMASFVYSLAAGRKRDLGIYLAIGYKKLRVGSMFAFELLISVLLGVLIAALIVQNFGAELSNGILLSALDRASEESLAVTTSLSVEAADNEKEIIKNIVDRHFVRSSILDAVNLILPIIAVGFGAALIGIFKLNVMTLLSKEGS